MDDRAIVVRCAKAMGWRAFKETRGNFTLCVAIAPGGRMPWEGKQKADPERYTEVPLDEAMKIGFFGRQLPNPLNDDLQCMALVKRFRIDLECVNDSDEIYWSAYIMESGQVAYSFVDPNLNRAICLAVATMQEGK